GVHEVLYRHVQVVAVQCQLVIAFWLVHGPHGYSPSLPSAFLMLLEISMMVRPSPQYSQSRLVPQEESTYSAISRRLSSLSFSVGTPAQKFTQATIRCISVRLGPQSMSPSRRIR